MAYGFIAETKGHGGGTATPAMNTTGANLIVANVAQAGAPITVANFTDNLGNTWSLAADAGAGGPNCSILYCLSPTVGASHTFQFTNNFPAIQVLAFSGAAASSVVDQTNHAGVGAGSTTIQTGSVTPTQDNELIVAGIALDSRAAVSAIDSGFTTPYGEAGDNSTFFGGYASYLIQTTAAAVNPTWTFASDDVRAAIASFKASGGVAFVAQRPLIINQAPNRAGTY